MARKLQSVDNLVGPAVAETIQGLTLAPEDAAAVRLAERYAAAIDAAHDDPEVLEKIGPKLLAVLAELGASPKARAALRKGPATAGSKLEALRARRA